MIFFNKNILKGEILKNRIIVISLAYVGVLTGAGLASGQELMQYFIGFGKIGIIGIGIVGILHAIFGKIILTLGSYYRSKEHSGLLNEIAHPLVARLLDYSLVFTCFVIGFVMIAGAGANLNQEFEIPSFVGALICSLMIIFLSMLDFEKVTKIIGFFTPLIFLFIIIAFVYAFIMKSHDFSVVEMLAKKQPTNTPSIWIAIPNYFSICFITGTSMAIVMGGDIMNPKIASKSGLIGGALTGLLGLMIGFTIYAEIAEVSGTNIPTQIIIREISPWLGLIMSLVIYGMIFNTGISVYYSMAKRFSGESKRRFKIYIILLVSVGFALSFFGFKKLVGIMYPVLGYIGLLLLATMIAAWIKDKGNIKEEIKLRSRLLKLMIKKFDDNKIFTKKDQKTINNLIEKSNIENKELKEEMRQLAKNKIEDK